MLLELVFGQSSQTSVTWRFLAHAVCLKMVDKLFLRETQSRVTLVRTQDMYRLHMQGQVVQSQIGPDDARLVTTCNLEAAK